MTSDRVPAEHRTVSRVTRLLELVAATSTGARLADLADTIDAPRSSVHALLSGLVATGYLVHEGGRYRIGPAVGALVDDRAGALIDAAHPAMTRLLETFGETVMLSVRVGASLVYVDVLESEHRIRYSAPMRTRRPLYPTSPGKTFLAYGPRDAREEILQRLGVVGAELEQVLTELEAVRALGYSVNRGETLPDVTGVSSPVLSTDGRVGAALSVAGPTTRLRDRVEDLGEGVRTEARSVRVGATEDARRWTVGHHAARSGTPGQRGALSE